MSRGSTEDMIDTQTDRFTSGLRQLLREAGASVCRGPRCLQTMDGSRTRYSGQAGDFAPHEIVFSRRSWRVFSECVIQEMGTCYDLKPSEPLVAGVQE